MFNFSSFLQNYISLSIRSIEYIIYNEIFEINLHSFNDEYVQKSQLHGFLTLYLHEFVFSDLYTLLYLHESILGINCYLQLIKIYL